MSLTLTDPKIRSHLRCTKLIYFWNSQGLFSWTFHLSRSKQSSTRTTPFLALQLAVSSAGAPPADVSSVRTADLARPVDGGEGEGPRSKRLGHLRFAFVGLLFDLCLCLRGQRRMWRSSSSSRRASAASSPLSKLALNDLPTRLSLRPRLGLDLDLLSENDRQL